MSGRKRDREVWDALVMVLQFGINMIVPIVLCVMLGIWIGRRTGLDWMSVPFFFVGALAGGTNIYKIVRKLIREAEREDASSVSAQMAAISEKYAGGSTASRDESGS